MSNCRINILCVEPSDIVYEGLANLLVKTEPHYYISRIRTLDELIGFCLDNSKADVVIVNPVVLQNRINEFVKLKKNFSQISWLGLIYSFFNNEIINLFDDLLNINDTSEIITKIVSRTIKKCKCKHSEQEDLSERETEVLVQLVKGLANKEIANELNISIHTVISHRKNIIEKTGIKSLPGLTIYAISKRLVPLEY